MFSTECRAIISYFEALGVEGKVTDVNTPGIHAKLSYHYAQGTGGVGLAVDFGLKNPSYDDPRYVKIFNAFLPVSGQLAELICAVPGISYNIRDGQKTELIDPQHHHNHVHVAVRKGTLLVPPNTTKETIMAKYGIKYMAEVPNGKPDSLGRMPYVGLGDDGSVFALNGATYHGDPKDVGVNRNDWVGISVHIDGSYTCYADEVQRDSDGSYHAPTYTFPAK